MGKLFQRDARLSHALCEGRTAARDGGSTADNPHPADSPAGLSWLQGFTTYSADPALMPTDVPAEDGCAVRYGEGFAPAPSPPVAPTALTPGVLSGTPAVGETLTVTEGTWAGEPLPTITHQWQRDANAFIDGATGLTYVVQAEDAGHAIGCIETAINDAGAKSQLSDPPSVLIPAALAAGTPTADWVKADIVDWLLAHGATEPKATLQGMLKADLLAMVP